MRKLTALAVLVLTLTACAGGTGPQPASEPALKVSVNPAAPQVGQKVTFPVSLTGGSGTWNVALFNENPDGSVDQIYPNRLPDGQPTLTPGATLILPPANAKYFLSLLDPSEPTRYWPMPPRSRLIWRARASASTTTRR